MNHEGSANQDADEAKAIWHDAHVRRDQMILEELRTKGFCFAVLDGNADPERDFLIYLDGIGGWPTLVIAAPEHTTEQIDDLYSRLPRCQLEDGTQFEVPNKFFPAPDSWFRFRTDVVCFRQGLYFPGALHREGSEHTWAHCADLHVTRAGTRTRLRVIHVSLDRDATLICFLAPNSLSPGRVICSW